MNLRTILGAAVAAGAILTTPAFAGQHATVCDSPTSRNQANDVGTTGRVAGICVDNGGYIEVGQSGTQIYVVASSDELGYVGVSNFNSTGTYTTCQEGGHDVSEGGSGTNSGGCYGVDGFGQDPVDVRDTLRDLGAGAVADTIPLPVCGDNTGEWYDGSRDGCRADAGDVSDTVADLLVVFACVQANPTNVLGCF